MFVNSQIKIMNNDYTHFIHFICSLYLESSNFKSMNNVKCKRKTQLENKKILILSVSKIGFSEV